MNLFHSFNSKKPVRKAGSYYVIYTALFILISFVVYASFLRNGKSMIWKPDGLTQHFNAFVYYGNWGRQIFRTLLQEHRLEIPLLDFSIGYGSDILTTLQYYVIGDPFSLVAFITPVRFMEFMYNTLILLRVYFTGITFSMYCFYLKREKTPVLAGALSYAFCGYLIVLSPQHPSFINPLIYLPLLLLGVEMVFQKKKGHVLIASAALSAITNFYFFYMLVLLVIIYCVIRFCTMKHESLVKDFFTATGRTFFFALTGTAIGGLFLLPVVRQFMTDSRADSTLTNPILYPLDFYVQFPDAFISMEYSSFWTHLGFTGVALLCVLVLFLKRKKYAALKTGFVVLTLMLLLPAAGSMMNGFSYSVNRWCFGYSFLIALILVYIWPELFTLSAGEKCKLCIAGFLYMILLVFLPHTGSSNAFFSLALMLASILFLVEGHRIASVFTFLHEDVRRKLPRLGLLLLLILGILANSVTFYRIKPADHIGRFVDYGEALPSLQNTGAGMMSTFYQNDAAFSRYAQDPLPVRNDTINHTAYSIDYYWSLSNGSINQYFDELAIPFQDRPFKYNKLDHRAGLHALAGVQYYVSHHPDSYIPYPYGKTRMHEYSGNIYYVSETNQYLPLGYTYDHTISRETYESLSYLQRQQALLQGVVCESAVFTLPEAETSFADTTLSYEISHDSSIQKVGDSYYALEDGATLTLSFQSLPDCETYLLLEGLQAHSMTDIELMQNEDVGFLLRQSWDALSVYEKQLKRSENTYNHLQAGTSTFVFSCASDILNTKFSYHTRLSESSFDRTDYLVNMGYSDKVQTFITLTLPYAGEYSFENLEVLCLPMSTLPEQLNSRTQSVLEQVVFDTNQVSGTVTTDQPKILCLSIPWSDGWTVFVDGKESPLFQANTMFMALELDAGEHIIELQYETPSLKTGTVFSICGIILWVLYGFFTKKKSAHS